MKTYPKLNALMIQGCTSDAGKTVLVAGLCRWLKNKDQTQSIAPFKPQNMALNSAVTRDGGEIGRAQALQAIAAGVDAHTDMNPILIKPSSDTKAQIIVQGKASQNMDAGDFHDYKRFAMPYVLSSFERLTQQYNHIIIEGAGSPAEINLRENDIANMGFAEEVDCPVILIADIDRGGVFAHIVGTLELLSKSEQERVIGVVINRFRGDISLLEPGLEWLEQRIKKPVLGVLPYIKNFYLDAEDALKGQQASSKTKTPFTVVVPVLERISNHTDFDTLNLHEDVHLLYATPGLALPKADLIILPGSKNVRRDLELLKSYGWDDDIKRHLRFGGKVFGICGGYQILGKKICDPHGVEDIAGDSEGLGLLNTKTILHKEKTLKQCSVRFIHHAFLMSDSIDKIHNSNSKIEDKNPEKTDSYYSSYEIHNGVTQVLDARCKGLFAVTQKNETQPKSDNFSHRKNEYEDGIVSSDNTIAGSYQHGIFDEQGACDIILHWAGYKNTSKHSRSIGLASHRETQLNRLADVIDKHLDQNFLSALLN